MLIKIGDFGSATAIVTLFIEIGNFRIIMSVLNVVFIATEYKLLEIKILLLKFHNLILEIILVKLKKITFEYI